MKTDYENKQQAAVSKYDEPNFKPKSLKDAIEWHKYARYRIQEQAEEANAKLDEYKRGLLEADQAERARRDANNRFEGAPVLPQASMFFFPQDDRELQRLEEQARFFNSEVMRLDKKISEMEKVLARVNI